MSPAPLRNVGARRALGCTLSILLGLAGATLLLLLAGRPALAAPASTTLPYPGANPCDTSLQACIEGASAGDTIVIQPGTYITSITLNKIVNLTGVASNTVILQALPSQRVLTITNAVFNSAVISGLTFTGGDVTGAGPYPANCGGGISMQFNSHVLFTNVIISGNTGGSGGGLCADNGAALHMTGSQVLSNTATTGDGGGGARVIDAVDISGSLFQGNQCLASNCKGGGLLSFFNPMAITGTTFISNSADGAGGGLYNYNSATVSGGLFLHNQCSNTSFCNGGGLYAAGTLTLSGASFISNVAHFEGGALVVFTGQITDTLFQDNACSESGTCWGGGLFAITHTTLSGAQFLSNTAQSRAGGAYFSHDAEVSSSQFLNDTCTQIDCLGGALVASGLLLTDTTFMTNTAVGGNGAVYAIGVTNITRGLFQNNRCTQDGCQAGALRTDQLIVSGTQFLTNTARDGGGAVTAGGAAALTNALFQGNTCTEESCGGGGLLAGNTLALTGTNFISNSALAKGGGVYAGGAAVRLSGGQFLRNTCTADGCQGGGVSVDGPLTVNGTTWLTNTARFWGGGVYAGGPSTLAGGTFQGNTCTQTNCQGGGLYIFVSSPLTLTNMQFLSNTAVGQGGGARAGGTAALAGGTFQGNRCTQSTCTGGGLYAAGGLTVSGTQFLNNQSHLDGAGALAGGAAVLTGGLFQNNSCSQDGCQGGGLRAGANVAVSGTQFMTNSTHFDGGGLYAGGAVTLTGGVFQGNHCTQDSCEGGGLFLVTRLALTDTVFNGNSAKSDGGGVFVGDNALLVGGSFQGNTCLQDNCRGGGLYANVDLSLTGTAFLSNSARFSGGGMVANAGGAARIDSALFLGNQCTQSNCQGGGLYTLGSLALTNTRFLGNLALPGGGGALQTAGSATVYDGVFMGNRASQGGALYHNGGAGSVVNTLFAENYANSGGAALYLNATSGQFNLLFDTIAVSYTQIVTPAVTVFKGSVGITDTIIANHNVGIQRSGGTVFEDYNLFSLVPFTTTGVVAGGAHSQIGVGDPVFYSPSVGNYHLWYASHAIDIGVDAGVYVDFEGETRPQNGGFDVGYDEYEIDRLYLPMVRR